MSGERPEALVEVRNLRKHFRSRRSLPGRRRPPVRAVDGVSFRIRRGDTLGLVGESGAGKSTTARALLRLVEPTAGEIRYDGRDVRAMGRRELRAFRRRAQLVFQDPFSALNPRRTVGALLEEVMAVHGLAPAGAARARRVAELLEQVGLSPSDARRYPHQFSGGQRQRIGIARALAVEPEFLVLDEPVSALDVSVRAQVLNLLLELQEELGLTYLFIAHDLSVVEHVSDRVAVMYLGRIVESGPADALSRGALHPYTKALVSAVLRPHPERGGEDRRIVVAGEAPDPAFPPGGCPFHPRCWHPDRDRECEESPPVLEEKGTGRFAACWKVGSAERGRGCGKVQSRS